MPPGFSKCPFSGFSRRRSQLASLHRGNRRNWASFMKINISRFAAEQGLAAEMALMQGMEEMPKEFLEKGAED
jgi:hypothetical protein